MAETITAISAVQSKPCTDQKRQVLSAANSGENNPMSIAAIAKRTGVQEDDVRHMLSAKNSGRLNGFYGRQHKPETLAKLAKSRADQCKMVTAPELAIWGMLHAMRIDFEYQVAIDRYIVDFLLSGNRIIEIYGDYWHAKKMRSSNVIVRRKDEVKIRRLKHLGYSVLIIWESEIFRSTDSVIKRLSDL